MLETERARLGQDELAGGNHWKPPFGVRTICLSGQIHRSAEPSLALGRWRDISSGGRLSCDDAQCYGDTAPLAADDRSVYMRTVCLRDYRVTSAGTWSSPNTNRK